MIHGKVLNNLKPETLIHVVYCTTLYIFNFYPETEFHFRQPLEKH